MLGAVGGDVHRAMRVSGLMKENGFRVEDVIFHSKVLQDSG